MARDGWSATSIARMNKLIAAVTGAQGEDFFRTVVDCLPVPVIGLDPQARVTLWSPAASEVFGYRAEVVVGEPLPILLSDCAALYHMLRELVMQGRSFAGLSGKCLCRDGKVVSASIAAAPMRERDGRIVGALAIIDVQAEMRHAAMHEIETDRVQRLRSRLATVDAAREAAELALRAAGEALATRDEALAARDEALGFVAHELRNPLGAVLMNATYLRDAASDLDPARVRELAENILRSTGRMSRLIRDLQDAARIEAGHFPIDLERALAHELIEEVLSTLSPLASRRGLSIEESLADEQLAACCDRARIVQVLSNLVENAVKFTPPGGCIRVAAEADDDCVRFAVRDTGSGIAPEDLPRIFDRYYQAQHTARLGSGLGLFISRAIVEAHGGRIGCESDLGRGSTFHFTLPRARRRDTRDSALGESCQSRQECTRL
jgi:PAS domain S-box-containing protein